MTTASQHPFTSLHKLTHLHHRVHTKIIPRLYIIAPREHPTVQKLLARHIPHPGRKYLSLDARNSRPHHDVLVGGTQKPAAVINEALVQAFLKTLARSYCVYRGPLMMFIELFGKIPPPTPYICHFCCSLSRLSCLNGPFSAISYFFLPRGGSSSSFLWNFSALSDERVKETLDLRRRGKFHGRLY